MRPTNLKTKIFLDSGDPNETREIIKLLGFLDGQTTNPTLISKNPETSGKKFTKNQLLGLYKEIVQEISNIIPNGSVSVEVYADRNTTSEQMLGEGREMFSWIPIIGRLDESFKYNSSNLKSIPYQEIVLNKPWQEYNISHELTDIGMEKFSSDWNMLIR